MRWAVVFGVFNLALLTLFLAGLAKHLGAGSQSLRSAILHVGLAGIAIHAIVPVGVYQAVPAIPGLGAAPSGDAIWRSWMLHMALLGRDALPELSAILSGTLWTTDHVLLPFAERDQSLLRAEHAFWSTIGSLGIPTTLIGITLVLVDCQGLKIPTSIPVVLVLWSAAGSAMMEPSGFPLFLLISLLLLAERVQQWWQARHGA